MGGGCNAPECSRVCDRERVLENPLHGRFERHIGLGQGGGKAGVGREARIGVDLQNPRPALAHRRGNRRAT